MEIWRWATRTCVNDAFMYTGFAPAVTEVVIRQAHFEAAFEAFFSDERLLDEYARRNWLDNPCLAQRGLCKGHEDDECQRVDDFN